MGICPSYANLDIGTVKKTGHQGLKKKKEEEEETWVAQLVKNPAAMRETWVQSLGLKIGLGRSPGEGNSYPL